MNSRALFVRACFVAATVAVTAFAQPSGGPYGPLRQTYALPAGAAHTYYVAPDGKAEAAGMTLEQPTTLAAALAKAVTGDAVILRGGTYRVGDLRFNQGIVLQPHADEEPVLKGTLVANQWTAQPNGLWRTSWKPLFPAKPADWWRRPREGRKTPLHLFNNDMVFVDGQPLKTVAWEGDVDAGSFSVDYDNGHIYIGVDPTNRTVEITAFDNALTRTIQDVHGKKSDGKGVTLRGLTFTQYAFRALEIEGHDPEGLSPDTAHGNDVVGSVIEHETISHCSRAGGYLRGNNLVIRHCKVTDTSTEGLFILSSNDVLIEKNIFTRNNVENITGYFPALVKIFNQSYRVVCRDNLVIDAPNSNGIWYDVGNIDGVFVDNWVENVGDGFFFEISKGALCVGNVFVNCDKGLRSLNASGVQAYHNTFVNTVASFERTERSAVGDHFDWHPATGPDVTERFGHAFVGNLLVADAAFPKALLRFEQPAALRAKLTEPQVAQFDDNVYVRRGNVAGRPLIVWSPNASGDNLARFNTPADLAKVASKFESRSRYLDIDYTSVVRSPQLGHYEPVGLPAATPPAALPEKVAKLLSRRADEKVRAPGAYPVRR